MTSVHSESSAWIETAGHRIYKLYWHGVEPELPVLLQGLPNISFIEDNLKNFHWDVGHSVSTGCKISCRDPYPLRLEDTTTSGTIGFVGRLENLGPLRHVIATVGHVIDEAQSIHFYDDADNKAYALDTVPEFARMLGIPRFRLDRPGILSSISLNQICLLETSRISSGVLKCSIPNINCNAFTPTTVDDDPGLVARDPKLADIEDVRCRLDRGEYVSVYKLGAASGFTAGNLREIRRHDDDSVDLYVLNIEWNSPIEPFTIGGDSGSLVWARQGDVIIPLGLHCGSTGTTSFALSLWSFCEEISSSLDADLFFCDSAECGPAACYEL